MLYCLFLLFSLGIVLSITNYEETKYKTSIYKTSLKTPYNLQLTYKKALRTIENVKRNNDYNYPDWEEATPDQYDFLFTTKPNSSPETSLIITNSETSSSSIPSSLSPSTSNETTSSTVVENTRTFITPSIRTTYTTVAINASSTVLNSTTVTSTSTIKTELTDFPEVTTEDIFKSTTTSVAVTISTHNPIVDDIRNTKREGFFTASLLVLLRTAYAKDPNDLAPLIFTLHTEVVRNINIVKDLCRMNANHELNMFGPVVVELFTSMVRVAATTNLELVRTQIDYTAVVLDDRRNKILPDLNAVFDVVDNIYNEDDLKNIANAIKDVKDYPEVQQEAKEIVQELFQAFLFIPHGRIQEESNRRRNQIRKTKQPILSTSPVDFMEDWNYVKNATIMEDVKHRMKKYKKKFKHIKKNEKEKFRGPTTTTTTTTTTIRPKMHKSNYYIRKYVRKNLYKMKTTTKKTTRFRYRYYGKIRKFNIAYSKSNDVYSKSESEGYYSDDNIGSDESPISLEDNEDKAKETTPLFIFNNKYEGPLTVKAITEDSKNEGIVKNLDVSDSDPELKFKLNLKDALIHSDFKITNHRRFLEQKANKIKHNTFSDDEVVLKRGIYKVFGYKDNFAEMIKQKKNRQFYKDS
ncbi:unnamed protein product, partial [Brenthis ino]